MSVPKRQFVVDDDGKPTGVIVPLEEYERVKPLLEPNEDAAKLEFMKQAVSDEAFMADLRESMQAFVATDAAWWEPDE